MFRKKITVGRFIPPFFLRKCRIWPFLNYLHDSNSFFWAQRIKSELFFGRTVSTHRDPTSVALICIIFFFFWLIDVWLCSTVSIGKWQCFVYGSAVDAWTAHSDPWSSLVLHCHHEWYNACSLCSSSAELLFCPRFSNCPSSSPLLGVMWKAMCWSRDVACRRSHCKAPSARCLLSLIAQDCRCTAWLLLTLMRGLTLLFWWNWLRSDTRNEFSASCSLSCRRRVCNSVSCCSLLSVRAPIWNLNVSLCQHTSLFLGQLHHHLLHSVERGTDLRFYVFTFFYFLIFIFYIFRWDFWTFFSIFELFRAFLNIFNNFSFFTFFATLLKFLSFFIFVIFDSFTFFTCFTCFTCHTCDTIQTFFHFWHFSIWKNILHT